MSWAEALTRRRGYLLLALVLVGVDQLTKWAAHAHLAARGRVEVIPGLFNLDYSRNPGGLFGYFRDLEGPLRTVLLSVLPLVAVVLILGYLLRGTDTDRPTRLGLALILGGAIGNLIDRVVRGEVIDFLDVYVSHAGAADWLVARFGTAHWPTFNVADSGIVCGAFLLLWTIVRPTRPAEASAARESVGGDGKA